MTEGAPVIGHRVDPVEIDAAGNTTAARVAPVPDHVVYARLAPRANEIDDPTTTEVEDGERDLCRGRKFEGDRRTRVERIRAVHGEIEATRRRSRCRLPGRCGTRREILDDFLTAEGPTEEGDQVEGPR